MAAGESGGARKAAVVTGAARGIGRAVAERLLAEGWAVALADRDREALSAARKALAGEGDVLAVRADVSREGDIRRLAEKAAGRWGALHGLVNNAGFMIRKPLEALSRAEWDQVLGTNLTGAFLCARAFAPMLRAAGGGGGAGNGGAAIVNVASTRAGMSEPDTESYAASKGGLVALTHALAVSLGPEIRVNAVSPGWIDTAGEALRPADHDQHPAGRVGAPADVAGLVAWLLGPESGFVTGAEFVADGGMTRKMIYAD